MTLSSGRVPHTCSCAGNSGGEISEFAVDASESIIFLAPLEHPAVQGSRMTSPRAKRPNLGGMHRPAPRYAVHNVHSLSRVDPVSIPRMRLNCAIAWASLRLAH